MKQTTTTVCKIFANISTKPVSRCVVARITGFFHSMNERSYLILDLVRSRVLDLNPTESILASCFFGLLAQNPIQYAGKPYYMADYKNISVYCPILPNKVDTLRRLYKNLENLGLIQIIKIDNHVCFTPSQMLRDWGTVYKSVEAGKNPVEAGKNPVEAEKNPVEAGKNPVEAEKNPVEAGKNPVEAEKNPVEAGKNSVEAEKNPVEAEKNPPYINNINNNINNNIKKDAKASKENPDGFSQADFFNEEKTVKASVKFGFTPDALDVRKQVIEKVDNYFDKLVFPFDSDEFKRNFYILMCQPKWRTSQKSFSAIQANLNGLSKYPEEFALILIKESISKGWAALEYDSTPEKYEKWEKMERSVKTELQSSKEIADMMKYLNNDFD